MPSAGPLHPRSLTFESEGADAAARVQTDGAQQRSGGRTQMRVLRLLQLLRRENLRQVGIDIGGGPRSDSSRCLCGHVQQQLLLLVQLRRGQDPLGDGSVVERVDARHVHLRQLRQQAEEGRGVARQARAAVQIQLRNRVKKEKKDSNTMHGKRGIERMR